VAVVAPAEAHRASALKGPAMDRKMFLKVLVGAGASLPCLSISASDETGKCKDATCTSDANAVRYFLTQFLIKEENNLSPDDLFKLMKERGRACCRNLAFRQKLIDDSNGDVDKLVELMGKIVGPENCTREGDNITLIYPTTKCLCSANPVRPASPDDPWCNCSAANNQLLFETVSGRPVSIRVIESPRRGGLHCRFLLRLG
jgi:hypothetical protein